MTLTANARNKLVAALGDAQVADQFLDILNLFHGTAPAAALTAQLTTITPADAEGTPDYNIAAITDSTPFGFASAQEAITVLYVIKNLQTRLAEVEARLETLGLVTAN